MMTVKKVSQLTGVSIRTLQYYDTIGLLKPDQYTDSGYRLYGTDALKRLQQILLFRELEFSLKEIRAIMDAPDFDTEKALQQQIELLTLKKDHLEKLIEFAGGIKNMGGEPMDFTVFDTQKIDEYAKRAKEQWGSTAAYSEYEKKTEKRTEVQQKDAMKNLMMIFKEFGTLRGQSPAAEDVQKQVRKLQDYITANFYKCTPEILSGLGQMYTGDPEFTKNIDAWGGAGTAAFAAEAISVFCRSDQR